MFMTLPPQQQHAAQRLEISGKKVHCRENFIKLITLKKKKTAAQICFEFDQISHDTA